RILTIRTQLIISSNRSSWIRRTRTRSCTWRRLISLSGFQAPIRRRITGCCRRPGPNFRRFSTKIRRTRPRWRPWRPWLIVKRRLERPRRKKRIWTKRGSGTSGALRRIRRMRKPITALAEAFPAIGTVRAKLGIKADDDSPIKNEKEREALKEKYGKIVDDGMNYLQKAIDLNPQYDDAMTYLNLLLRKRADLADTPEDAKADLAQAEKWYNKSLDIKKMKAAQPQKQQTS